jgi:glutamate---cysteine ligase / carboxylate-amine ligase
MADEMSPGELLRAGREAFAATEDFTVAVEEEFAILDPETLSLTNRFEELKAAAVGTELEEHLVGELIASEVEVRTGRCEGFGEAAARMGERRDQLHALADQLGVLLGATGTHPWSPWHEQRLIDTPHYRLNDELLRWVVWRNNSFGLHVHVAVKGADRAVRVCDHMRHLLPELLALSASSPFIENVFTHLHSVRSEIFTKLFPRCGIPDAYGSWAEFEDYVLLLFRTGSIMEHTQMWWSIRPHLSYPTVEIRICDSQPDLGEARSLAALSYALAAQTARALDEGEPLPLPPHRLIEENFWRAIRYGLQGDFIDLETGELVNKRKRIEQLYEWVQPVADEIGATPYFGVPAANAAERQIARYEGGATLEEIYAEQVRRREPEPVGG